jgi:chemotaxis methyl-accepting protein methylase
MNEIYNGLPKNFQQKLDVDISRYDPSFVSQIIKNRQLELKLRDYYHYIDCLLDDENEREIFENMLQISYSIFFRNILTYSTLEQIVIPKLLIKKASKSNANVRIWSAACASGQEPYSLAIVLENCLSKNYKLENYHIFATDIDPKQLEIAKRGVFSEENLKNVTLHDMQKWFYKSNNNYLIDTYLKQKVSFSVFDLMDQKLSSPPDSIFGDFDIIMCANIMFYFNEESRKLIFNKLIASALQNTYFITGEVEREYFISRQFVELYPQSAIFQLPYNYQL